MMASIVYRQSGSMFRVLCLNGRPMYPRHGVAAGLMRDSSLPVGSCTLTLTNVVVGARIAIRDQAKTVVMYDEVAAAGAVGISLPVYSPGSPLNDWLIDVRKGSSAPFYQRYKTLLTATVGTLSLYINQLPDQR